LVLLAIALIREILGFGWLFGITILGDWWIKWAVMVMAPNEFFYSCYLHLDHQQQVLQK